MGVVVIRSWASTENWGRPATEVSSLLGLVVQLLEIAINHLMKVVFVSRLWEKLIGFLFI